VWHAKSVPRASREVGVEGRLGGQAHVPGAAGTWKDLTGNISLLGAQLLDHGVEGLFELQDLSAHIQDSGVRR
jgi:hypothetical protein